MLLNILLVSDTALASLSWRVGGHVLKVNVSISNKCIRCGQLSAGDLLISVCTLLADLASAIEDSSEYF